VDIQGCIADLAQNPAPVPVGIKGILGAEDLIWLNVVDMLFKVGVLLKALDRRHLRVVLVDSAHSVVELDLEIARQLQVDEAGLFVYEGDEGVEFFTLFGAPLQKVGVLVEELLVDAFVLGVVDGDGEMGGAGHASG